MAGKKLPTPDECQALWAALADVQEEIVDPFCVRVLDVANSDVGRLDVNFESIGALLVWVEETRSLLVTMIEQLTQVDLVAFRELADMAREAPGQRTGFDPHLSTLARSAPEIVTATRQFVERELAA